MPHWVYNAISIEGPKEELSRFLDENSIPVPQGVVRAKDGSPLVKMVPEDEFSGFSFWNTIAPPEDELETYFANATGVMEQSPHNWYLWNIRNWGVRWDATSVEVTVLSRRVLVSFCTPWNRPKPFYLALENKWPSLDFEFLWRKDPSYRYLKRNREAERVLNALTPKPYGIGSMC